MRKEVKEAAQLYGLHSIGLDDLLKVCESISEAREAIIYAEEFGYLYGRWCEKQQQKRQEIKNDWDLLNSRNEDEDEDWMYMSPHTLIEMYNMERQGLDWNFLDGYCKEYWEDYDKAEAERHSSYYTEQELQDAFDTFCKNRRKQVLKIGKEAKAKKVSSNTIYRFMQSYKLNGPERTVFWLAYYGALV